MSNDQVELLAEFIAESKEGLAGIEGDLLTIEADGANADIDLINKVFRAIHSIKGASGFLGLTHIGELAHAAENILTLIRGKELVPTPAIIEQLLRAVDRLSSMTDDPEASNQEDVSAEVQALKACLNPSESPATKSKTSPANSTATPPTPEEIAPTKGPIVDLVDPDHARQATEDGKNLLGVQLDLAAPELRDRELGELLEQIKDVGAVLAIQPGWDEILALPADARPTLEAVVATVLDLDTFTRFFDIGPSRVRVISMAGTRSAAATPSPSPAAAESVKPTSPTTPPNAPAKRTVAPTVDTNIRVSISVLDRLMNLAGELVLGRNQLLQAVSHNDLKAVDHAAVRLDQITTELQESIMQTRMQPIGNVFQKFTRVIRDLSNQLGKKIQLQIEGSEVELDKTIIEAIGDPLTHLIRNAVDHGIESPDVRQKAGKSPTGTVVIKAFHQDGKVNISISDDGKGIDPEKVKKKAVEKGVIDADEATGLSEREAVRLIFHPGFSLAEKITDVSGRGVGMDVVRTNFEKLGGVIDIDSVVGQGSSFNIRLPLTLAIIPSLIVRSAQQRFAVPQVNIVELVRIRSTEVSKRIRRVKNAEVLQLRGSLLPLVRLSDVLNSEGDYEDWRTGDRHPERRHVLADRRHQSIEDSPFNERSDRDRRGATVAGALNIIMVESGQLRYGLVVDSLQDSEEIVVKPLGRHLQECRCLSGATVLGDGCVALILDVLGIAQKVGMDKLGDEHAKHEEIEDAGSDDSMDVLFFQNNPDEFFGIPMHSVARIERVSVDRIDSVANREVLQYRGGTLELISLEQVIPAKPRQLGRWAYVIVFRACGQEVGLVAPRIFDVRRINAHLDVHTFNGKGLMGSATIDGKITRIIDTFQLVEAVHPEWITDAGLRSAPNEGQAYKVLLAEDSDFFRKRVTKLLEEEGYEVHGFPDGAAAWEELNQPGHDYTLVVTDIEMPNMNGFQLSQRIRNAEHTRHLPIIALTSLSSREDQEHGNAVGITRYLVKLDREILLKTLSDLSKQLKSISAMAK